MHTKKAFFQKDKMGQDFLKSQIGNKTLGFFHHAFILPGQREEMKLLLRNFLEEEFGIFPNNPDFFEFEAESFGIDDGREVKMAQSRLASSSGSKKIFLLSAHSFTNEAQNSLLKIFEEPTKDTIFFVLASSGKFFLPLRAGDYRER